MPLLRELREGGRPDLAYAVAKWGGVSAAAELAGLQTRKQARSGSMQTLH